jgi:AcrR family transcriptional regulator
MPRDPEETKRRIFDAARAEFAEHGIAGARIDRIAASAKANKQLIYAYFGNKRVLFEIVASHNVARFVDEVAFDPSDLPGYAAGMFDFYAAHPEVAKIGAWHSLEPGEEEHRVAAIEKVIRQRTRAIARAQAGGLVDPRLPAAELLALINAIAGGWAVATPERRPSLGSGARSIQRRRAAVIEAVNRIAAVPA